MTSSVQVERSLRDIMGLLRQARKPLALFVISAMIFSLAITYVFSEKYRAATLIMYRPTNAVEVQSNVVVQEKTALGFPVPSLPFEAVGTTIERLGKSERVLRRVVENLGLNAPETNSHAGLSWYYHEIKRTVKQGLSNTWQVLKHGRVIHEDPTTKAIIGLMKYTTIEAREDYTSTLIVVDKFPDRAARIVDQIGNVLVEEVKELSVQAARERSQELAHRLQVKGDEIKQAQSQIEALKREWGFHSLEDEMPLHLGTLETFQAKLLQNDVRLRDSHAALASLTTQRNILESTIPSSQTEQDDPLYGELRQLQARYDVEMKGLLNRRGTRHVDVVALAEKIENIEQQRSSLQATRVTNAVTSTNPSYESVHLQEIAARSRLEGLQAEKTALEESIRRLESRIVAPEIVSRMETLELHQRTLKDDYFHLGAALEESKTSELVDVPEIRVLFPATPVMEPIRPIRIYHVGLSGILALSVGIAAVFLLEFLRTQWDAPIMLLGNTGPNSEQSHG